MRRGVKIDATDAIGLLGMMRIPVKNVWRLRLGLWLARLAAVVLKCGLEVNTTRVANYRDFRE